MNIRTVLACVALTSGCASNQNRAPSPSLTYYCSYTTSPPRVAGVGDTVQQALEAMRSISHDMGAKDWKTRVCTDVGSF